MIVIYLIFFIMILEIDITILDIVNDNCEDFEFVWVNGV